MTSVTAETPGHVKAARALMGVSAEELADILPIGLATLRTFESGKPIKPSSRAAIYQTLYERGVRMQNGGSPGVKIVEPDKLSISLKRLSCPDCAEPLPAIRIPKNMRQSLWGGWTCKNCGIEISKKGKKLFPKKNSGS